VSIPQIVNFIKTTNAGPSRAKINTIRVANLAKEAEMPNLRAANGELIKAMQDIARDSGGVYKEVDLQDY
jgi:hypothetical protein